MFAFIQQKVGYTTNKKTRQVSTPIAFGPYETKDEATGAGIELIRTQGYDDAFYFDEYENNIRLEILNKENGSKSVVGFIVELG